MERKYRTLIVTLIMYFLLIPYFLTVIGCKKESPTGNDKSPPSQKAVLHEDGTKETTPIYRVSNTAWMGWSPLNVAKAKGFWEEQGIHVEVKTYTGEESHIASLIAGKDDLSFGFAGKIVDLYMEGFSPTILSETDWSHGGDCIIIKKGKNLADYLGQPIGVYAYHSTMDLFLQTYLTTQNLKLSQFRTAEMMASDCANQFIANRVPAIVLYEPFSIKALEEGDGMVVATSADYPGIMPECFFGLSDRIAEIPKEDIKKILRGWNKAVQWINEEKNWPEYQTILNTMTFHDQEPFSETKLRKMYSRVKIHNKEQLYQRNKTDGGLYSYIRTMKHFLMKYGKLERDFTVEDVFDNQYITEVLAETATNAADDSRENKPIYKIAYVSWVGCSFINVAKAKEFWEEQGIRVELETYASNEAFTNSLLTGKSDLIFAVVGQVAGLYMSDKPVTILYETNWSHGGDYIIIKKGVNLSDSTVKLIGIYDDQPTTRYFLQTYLASQGLNISQFRIVALNPRDLAKQFIAGRLVAIVNYEPFSIEAVEKGDGEIVATTADYEGIMPECIYGLSSRIKEIPREDIKKILYGLIKASQWLDDSINWPEYQDILNNHTFAGQETFSETELLKMFDGVKIHNPQQLYQRNKTNGGLYSYLKTLKAFMIENGRLKKDYTVKDIFDNQYIIETLEEGVDYP